MTGDFLVGFVFGAIVGGTLGAVAMAILAAAGAADDRIERMAQEREDGEHAV